MFVPRSLNKKPTASKANKPPAFPSSASQPSPVPPPSTTASGPSTPSATAASPAASQSAPVDKTATEASIAKVQKKAAAEQLKVDRLARELALMLAFVLSDAALSLDAAGLELGKWLTRLKYLPLTTILKHPHFQPLPMPLPPPAAIAKALRLWAPQLEARILLDEPRSFGGSRGLKEGSGGLEVGRVGGWQTVGWQSREDQIAREVYLEYLPSQLHTPVALLAHLTALLPTPCPLVGLSDPPYRNFATLVFDSSSSAKRFVQEWTWTGAKERAKGKTKLAGTVDGGPAPGAQELEAATKAGMRALMKADYAALEREYVALLAARRPAPPVQPPAVAPPVAVRLPVIAERSAPRTDAPPSRPVVASPPPYPARCLVFLKHLDTNTSKTALKDTIGSLLARAPGARKDAQASYIDWIKGGDTAHVRLPHCSLSTALLASLEMPTYHLPLLAAPPYLTSTPPAPDHPRLTAEVVEGERERLYWMAGGVKEAGRKEAVSVALAWDDDGGAKRKAEEEPSGAAGDGGGKAKRKKK